MRSTSPSPDAARDAGGELRLMSARWAPPRKCGGADRRERLQIYLVGCTGTIVPEVPNGRFSDGGAREFSTSLRVGSRMTV